MNSKYGVPELNIYDMNDLDSVFKFETYCPDEYKETLENSIEFFLDGKPKPKVEPAEINESLIGTEYQWVYINHLLMENNNILGEINSLNDTLGSDDSFKTGRKFVFDFLPDLYNIFYDYEDAIILNEFINIDLVDMSSRDFKKFKYFSNAKEEDFILSKVDINIFKNKIKIFDFMYRLKNDFWLGFSNKACYLVSRDTERAGSYILIPILDRIKSVNNISTLKYGDELIFFKRVYLTDDVTITSGSLDQVWVLDKNKDIKRIASTCDKVILEKDVSSAECMLMELVALVPEVEESEKNILAIPFHKLHSFIKKENPGFDFKIFSSNHSGFKALFRNGYFQNKVNEYYMQLLMRRVI